MRALSGDRGAAAARPGPARPRARRRGWRRRWSAAAATSRRASSGCGRAAMWRARSRRCARRCALDPERDDLAGDLAMLLSADGPARRRARRDGASGRGAIRTIRSAGLRLADAQAAAGQATAARETIAALLAARPDVPEVQRAARALGVPLPLDGFRVEGRAIIRAFEAAAVRYTAPAVMVLDRAVMRIFAGRHGDDADPPDRPRRQQGRRRQVGGDRDSARRRDPDPAHAQARRLDARARGDRGQGGDLGGGRRDRRLHRVGIPGHAPAVGGVRAGVPGRPFLLPVVRRADGAQRAPAGVARRRRRWSWIRAPARPARRRGSRSTARASPAFRRRACRSCSRSAPRCRRSSTCPSVRASAGVDWRRWARYLGEEFHDALRVVARAARAGAPHRASRCRPVRAVSAALAAAMVDWVTENIEATDELADPASFALARGRGSRTALALALARELRHPGPAGAGALAPGRRRGRADAAAGAGRLRGRAGRAGRRRARASRCSSTPTCACATRRSATCRRGSTGRACCACPTASFGVARKTVRRRTAASST